MSALAPSEGKFKEIDNKISALWSLKGSFTKDFHKTGRNQYRAGFRPAIDAAQLAECKKKLEEMLQKSTADHVKAGIPVEIKELVLDGSEEWELAFARGGKGAEPHVRFARDSNSIELGLTVDELNAMFKEDLTIKPYFVDIIVTPWVFEAIPQQHNQPKPTPQKVRAGVTLYLKRIAGISAPASSKP